MWELVQQHWGYGRGHARLYIKYRQEIPGGWRQRLKVYNYLAKSGWMLAKAGLRYGLQGDRKEGLSFYYLDLLSKLAHRLGFIRETLSRGYLKF